MRLKKKLLSELASKILAVFCVIALSTASLASGRDSELWSFVFFADTRSPSEDQVHGVSHESLDRVAHEIANDISDPNTNCELVLVGGDLIHGQFAQTRQSNREAYDEWKRAMKPAYDAFSAKNNSSVPIYPVRGNHETDHFTPGATETSVLEDWIDAFGKHLPQNGPPPPVHYQWIRSQKGLNYYVEHRNALFVAVDQCLDPRENVSINQPWVDHVLANRKEGLHVFVFGHFPAWRTAEQVNVGPLYLRPTTRDRFWASLRNAGVRFYLAGHEHYTGVMRISDHDQTMWQIVSGSGGAPLVRDALAMIRGVHVTFLDNKHLGYYIGTVTGNKVTLIFKYYSER